MQKTALLFGSLVALFGSLGAAHAQCVSVVGVGGQARMACGDFRPLRIGSAVLGDPPLIWSASQAALVPVPDDGRARLVGPTIPLEALIGRRVVSIGRAPAPVVYNNPSSLPGTVDQGIVLMRLPSARRVVIREAYARRLNLVRVKD